MIKFRILLAFLGLVLAGCATVVDTRSTPVLLAYESNNPAQRIAECIRDGWQAEGHGALVQTSGSLFTVISSADHPWHLVDVLPNEAGASVRYHFYRTWQSPPDSMKAAVQRCK